MKPIDTRLLEARSRARTSHVRIVHEPEWRKHPVNRRGYIAWSGGNWYRLSQTPQGWMCSCDGFHYTGCCKHLAALTRRSEREGWTLTTIAPAPYVPDLSQAVD